MLVGATDIQTFVDVNTRPETAPEPPIARGQVVLVQLQSALTLEGYTESSEGDPTFIHDPSITTAEWQNPMRPAVVLGVRWDGGKRLYRFSVAALSRWEEGGDPAETLYMPIRPILDESHSGVQPVHTQWPWGDTYCYAFKNPAIFYCLPSQVCSPSYPSLEEF